MLSLTRTQRLLCMLLLTGSYFIVELVVGIATNSLALIADSFHMASDVLALIVALAGIRMARRDPTNHYSYGFQRAELLGALVNGVFLLGLCFTISVDGVARIIDPEIIEQPRLVFIVGTIGLGVNLLGLVLFADAHGHSHGHGHGHAHAHAHENNHDEAGPHHSRTHSHDLSNDRDHSHDHDRSHDHAHDETPAAAGEHAPSDIESPKKDEKERRKRKNSSLNMRAVLLHILGDALGSVVVIATAVTIWKGDSDFANKYLDPIASLVIVCILIYASLPLVIQAASILLNAVPCGVDLGLLRTQMEAIPDVLGIHDLHIWQLSDMKIVASAHIRVAKCCSFMEIGSEIKGKFHAAGVHSVTVQPEFEPGPVEVLDVVQVPGNETDCLLRCEQGACDAYVCCPQPLRSVESHSD